MTKIDGRTKEAATKQLDESLKRLKTDRVDLVQHHEVIRYDDIDRILEPDGAMEALTEAKKAGKLRFIGFTGHKHPRIHLAMLMRAQERGIHFDTVQMPLNVVDAHFRSFAHLVLPEAVRQGVGVLGMKAFAGGVLFKGALPIAPIACLHYALSLPTSVVITGVDSMKMLTQAFEAVKSFQPLSQVEMSALLDQTAPLAKDGRLELFKTSSHFDTTAKHPDYLGGESKAVRALSPS